jgi:hypothetical protein
MAQNENYSQVNLRIGTEAQFNAKVDTLPAGTLFGVTDATVSKADLSTDLKNEINGKYAKPAGGIPKTDLASAVQTSLGKADSALQSVPGNYVTNTTYSAETRYGVAKIWKGTDNYLYIRTDGH